MKIFYIWASNVFYDEKENDHEGTRTLNLPIRSRTPYPLGHAASHMKKEIFSALNSGKKLKQFFCSTLYT